MEFAHIDIETWNPHDNLIKAGQHRYGEDAEVLTLAVSRENGHVHHWVAPEWRHVVPSDPEADVILAEISEGEFPVYAHNALFEHAVLQHNPDIVTVAHDRWRCTKTMAAFAGVRSSLALAGVDIGVELPKAPWGKGLIKMFSIPQTDGSRITPEDDPLAFSQFVAYCVRDVQAEQGLHKALDAWCNLEKWEHMQRAYSATLILNDNGYPVDWDQLAHLKEEYEARCGEVIGIFSEQTRTPKKVIAPLYERAAEAVTRTPNEGLKRFRDVLKLRTLTNAKEVLKTLSGPKLSEPSLIPTVIAERNRVLAKEAADKGVEAEAINEEDVPELTRAVIEAAWDDTQTKDHLLRLGALAGYGTQKGVRALIEEAEQSDDPIEAFQKHTGLKPSQRDAFQAWVQARGYPEHDMQDKTIARVLEEGTHGMSDETVNALENFRLLAFAAPKKIYAMEVARCYDNTVKGHFTFGGASRTFRWSASNTQPQNFRKVLDKARVELLERTVEALGHMTVEDVADCMRLVVRDPASVLLDADYSQIEARGVNWLAGQMDVVEKFASGEDLYKVMAAKIFKKLAEEINKDERTLGKIAELGCGYGIWTNGFIAACENWGVHVEEEMAEAAVLAYRETHPEVVKFWYRCEQAFRNALNNPGKRFAAGDRIAYTAGVFRGKKVVRAILPSGRPLHYFNAYEDLTTLNKHGNPTLRYWGHNQYTGQWTFLSTYGAKLCENVSQALAADCMMVGLANAVDNGFHPRMLVHDQLLSSFDGRGTDALLDTYRASLLDMPEWADGLPLAIDAAYVPAYAYA